VATFTSKRAYLPQERSDGKRYLVDRLWPRGIRKQALEIEGWLKEAAPTDALRRWFNHDPKKWPEFRRRYFAELDAHPEAWKPLVDAARAHSVTLVYGAKDTEHNNAVALAEYLTSRTEPRL
jgi:uncharacterized protein YeaO (DUF488 family)